MRALARSRDPAPLTAAQLAALGVAVGRELTWGLRAVRAEVARWRARAERIVDPPQRAEALEALADKRPLVDGAALFWILPRRPRADLLRLLATLQILANFHDRAGERAALIESSIPASSMSALAAVMDPSQPLPSTYGARDDYLHRLAATCRSLSLPMTRTCAGTVVLRELRRARAMDIEHALDDGARARRLEAFALREFDQRRGMHWWEMTAGASSILSSMAVLAIASDGDAGCDDLEQVASAYAWVAAAATLLDHYIDRDRDALDGSHNYLNYYPTPEAGLRRLGELIERALTEVGQLRRGERHRVIVAAMVAMYSTSSSARSPARREGTNDLIEAGGTLTRLLVPTLQVWRRAYQENDA